ncbi:Rad17 domain-containing protein [Rhizoctonia solani AG-1 IA]|uniref:Rad17 domain-containing protein n=1 Tax=Thanatephorus cucumeris (strain AG1-IA) TaxID=983506 RepID=L8WLF9_THACA|nr:Rad17 domain-containing protein [Rhizoctonia solani AG-1 IA]
MGFARPEVRQQCVHLPRKPIGRLGYARSRLQVRAVGPTAAELSNSVAVYVISPGIGVEYYCFLRLVAVYLGCLSRDYRATTLRRDATITTLDHRAMPRKAAVSPTRVPHKRPPKRSTLSSDSLFGFGTQPPSGNAARQLSVPRFNLSQGAGLSSQVQVIDLTEDDQAPPPMSTPPIPGPPAKKPRRMSPSPLANPPKIPGTHESDASHSGESRDTTGDAESLWVDIHAPETQIYCRKLSLSILGRWKMCGDGWARHLREARLRILALTGPSGSGKTATLQILARELEAEVVEWQANSDEFSVAGDYGAFQDYESATTKLASFLERAGVYGPLSLKAIRDSTPDPESKGKERRLESKHKILLLEDFPSISHPRVRGAFHAALTRFAEAVPPSAAVSSLVYPPLVLIISDAGLRADDTSPYSSSHRDDVLDIRSVLPPALLGSHYVTQINSSNSKSKSHGLPKETIDALIEAANGDIRSAITGVQFAFTATSKATSQEVGRKKSSVRGKSGAKGDNESCLGYGDPDEPDKTPIPLPKPLPKHLSEFERRPSKVDVSVRALHADSPLVISSALSQHTFQHIARSALLALPSPVPRRSQVTRKPAWFAARAKEREAEGAVEDAKRWLIEHGGTNGLGCGYWDRKSVVLDAGGLLGKFGPKVLFSQLKWDISGSQQADTLDEEESVTAGVDVAEADIEAMEKRAAGVGRVKEEKEEKGYLSDDDIDDFEGRARLQILTASPE